jgi:GcrA cell cycle regulator
MNWTDERKKAVIALWKEGYSATVIAARIGGVSRNAVLGLMNRNRELFPRRRGQQSASARPAASRSAGQGVTRRHVQARETRGGAGDDCSVGKRGAWPPADIGGVSARLHRPSAGADVAPVNNPASADASVEKRAIPRATAARPFPHRGMVLEGGAPEGVPFVALTYWQCAWPLVEFEDADAPDMPCCGRRRRGADAPTSPYCAEHAAIARGEGR